MKKFLRKIIFFLIILILCSALVFAILYKKISKLEYIPVPQQQELDIEKIVIQQGDVLALTLKNSRLSTQDITDILKELRKNININKCMPGDFYEIIYSTETGGWTNFWYYPSGVEFCSIKKSPDGTISSSKQKLAVTSAEYTAYGTIESSLWEAMQPQSVPADVILSFADAFAWKIDFLTDTRQGDTFAVIYEVEYINKKDTKLSSKIIAAQYKTGSNAYNAIYYVSKSGKRGFFDEEGKSVKSAFLKAPLQFRRISSHFTTSRMHPILKYARPHLGIDYAAPAGTPVSAVADGVVKTSKYSGGFGHLVILKHSNGYETYYGHLSKYGRGIRRGARVSQGQIIGYVGSTGLSTWPHLDFRIKRNGRFFNYLTMKQPPTFELKGNEKSEFISYSEGILNRLNNN